MKLKLPNVTICAADSQVPELASVAIRKSLAQCTFGAALLFTDASVEDESFQTVTIERLASRSDYSRFIMKQLCGFIETPYVLIVQWDGYVLDASAWSDEFLDYDLIGAKWPWYDDQMRVGNGGFSLRSRRLLEALRDPRFAYLPNAPEDDLICRTYRPDLEARYGIGFAPESLADRFSYEVGGPEAPTFGFHGLFNMWRHLDGEEMLSIAQTLAPEMYRNSDYVELLANLAAQQKFGLLRSLYARLRRHCELAQLRELMPACFSEPAQGLWLLDFCERQLAANGVGAQSIEHSGKE